jgi:predicted nucleic acid-binding protein
LGWIERLHGELVALDTAPLIYVVEKHPIFCPLIRPLFVALEAGVTSTVTLLEVLVQPIRNGNEVLAREYRAILRSSSALTVAPVSSEIAEEAARLRAKFNLRTPDSVQLATAVISRADAFLTNDAHLAKFRLPGLEVLVLDVVANSQ